MTDFPWGEYAGTRQRWDNVGDLIKGWVVSIRTEPSAFGKSDEIPVMEIQTKEHEKPTEVWCAQQQLLRELASVNPQRGGYIKIEYIANQNTGQPKPMKVFQVTYQPPKEGADQRTEQASAAASATSGRLKAIKNDVASAIADLEKAGDPEALDNFRNFVERFDEPWTDEVCDKILAHLGELEIPF